MFIIFKIFQKVVLNTFFICFSHNLWIAFLIFAALCFLIVFINILCFDFSIKDIWRETGLCRFDENSCANAQ